MLLNRKYLLSLLVGLVAHLHSYCQADIHFSQFYETPIIRNPALTGVSENNYKVTGYFRDQWNSVTVPYQTMLLDIEYRIKIKTSSNDFISFGLLGYSDKAGDLNQKISAFYPAINYNKCISSRNNSYLSVGFTGGYLQYSFDLSNARVNNQFVGGVFSPTNPTLETFPKPGRSQFDAGAGISYNFSPGELKQATYFLGASAYHFNQPEFSYYNQGFTENIRWNINAGMIAKLSDRYILQIPFNYTSQGTYRELIIGGLPGWRSFSISTQPDFEIYAGVLYRYNDAIIPAFKLVYKNLGVGISYDVNTSTLKEASNLQGGFEITLSLSGNYPNDKEYKMTVCPKF